MFALFSVFTLCSIKDTLECDVSPVLVVVSLAGKTVCFSIEFVCSFESDQLYQVYC